MLKGGKRTKSPHTCCDSIIYINNMDTGKYWFFHSCKMINTGLYDLYLFFQVH